MRKKQTENNIYSKLLTANKNTIEIYLAVSKSLKEIITKFCDEKTLTMRDLHKFEDFKNALETLSRLNALIPKDVLAKVSDELGDLVLDDAQEEIARKLVAAAK